MKVGAAASMVLALLVSGFAHAESPDLLSEGGRDALLATRHAVSIEVEDQVSDGCLPDPSALQSKLANQLSNHGFSVQKSQPLVDRIKVIAMGYESGPDECVVSLLSELVFYVVVGVPHSKNEPSGRFTVAPMTHRFGNRLLSGKKTGMQKRVENAVVEQGDILARHVFSAREEIFGKFKEIEDSFYGETLEENG